MISDPVFPTKAWSNSEHSSAFFAANGAGEVVAFIGVFETSVYVFERSVSITTVKRITGPEAYLSRGDPPETAASIWKNINTFVAILFRDHGNEFPELFGSLAIYAFTTLADALEHPPGSRFGRNMPLHLPAACQWILLAGTEVCNAIEEGYNGDYWTARAGQLWTREGGSAELNEERWLFWKHRFGELTADARLDAAMDWEAALAELSMCDLQIRNNSQGGLP